MAGLRLDYFVASRSLMQGTESGARVVDSQADTPKSQFFSRALLRAVGLFSQENSVFLYHSEYCKYLGADVERVWQVLSDFVALDHAAISLTLALP